MLRQSRVVVSPEDVFPSIKPTNWELALATALGRYDGKQGFEN
jgi:hypothetical protein